MTETAVRSSILPISIMLVLPGEELWGAEQLRSDLASAGLRLMAEEEFRNGEPTVARKPAAILVFLSGQLERDAAICRKWVDLHLAPVIVISPNNDEVYVLALFNVGIEDIVQRPIKSRELAARIRSILRRSQPALLTAQARTLLPAIPAAPARSKSRVKLFLSGLQKCFSTKSNAG
jgi:DNA-binding response OmpR family regulator